MLNLQNLACYKIFLTTYKTPILNFKRVTKKTTLQRGRPSFSSELIPYALLLRYVFKQAYKFLLEKFLLPSFSLLEKIQRGGVESITAAKSLLEKGHLSQDCVLMVDEMYLQKGTQFHSEEYIGANEDDELYKAIMIFMITGLKNIVPFIIKT